MGSACFKSFFKGYTEKLWGIPCTEISAEWAAQRIKGLSLGRAIRNALIGNDGKVKSLVEQFQFPKLGSGQLYDKITDFLDHQQMPVLTNTEVMGLHHEQGRITHVVIHDRNSQTESTIPCKNVISSIPLSALVQQLEPSPPPEVVEAARSLRFRNTILVYLFVNATEIFPDNWLYINDPRVELGRVTNFANWSPHMLANNSQTPLCCEYWCNFGDTLWLAPDAEILEKASQELRQIRLLRDEPIVSGFIVRLPRTYPVYAGNYKEALQIIQHYLTGFSNLQVVGRYGAFKYNNQDHSLLMGDLSC